MRRPKVNLSGAGGNWKTLDEKPDSRVIKQINDESCVAAVGQMLLTEAGIKIEQTEIISEIGSPAHSQRLADYLNRIDDSGEWRGGFVNVDDEQLSVLNSTGIWGAILRQGSGYGHMVLVEGFDDEGRLKIKDPFEATSYKMETDDFLQLISEAVFKL